MDALPPDLLDDTRRRLLAGDDTTSVAASLHAAGHCHATSEPSLARSLRRWRASFPAAEVVVATAPIAVKEAARRLDAFVSEIEEIGHYLRLQRERVEMGRQVEAKMGVPLRGVDEAVRTADQLIRTSSTIRAACGLAGREGARVVDDADLLARVGGVAADPVVARVLADPQKRSNVLRALRRILVSGDGMPVAVDVEAPSVSGATIGDAP